MKKLIISSDPLAVALRKLGHAVDSAPLLPVLNNLYCKVTPGQLELIGSNTEITILYRLTCEATESFEFLLNYKFLTKIVNLNKHCPLEIEATAKSVKIKGPNDAYEIKIAEKLKDFVKLPEVAKENALVVSTEILTCLHTALATMGKAEVNPRFAFVLMELASGKLTVASTDGSYMVFSKEFAVDHQLQAELLLSQNVIKALDGCDDINVYFHDKAILFDSASITIINTRTEEKFVNYRKVFPEDWPGNLTLQRAGLIEALGKCSLTDDQLHATRMNLENNAEVQLSADDNVLQVNVSVPGKYDGDVKLTTVNSEKFLKLLNQIEHEEITLAIHDERKSIILTAKEDAGYRGMIMPIASVKN